MTMGRLSGICWSVNLKKDCHPQKCGWIFRELTVPKQNGPNRNNKLSVGCIHLPQFLGQTCFKTFISCFVLEEYSTVFSSQNTSSPSPDYFQSSCIGCNGTPPVNGKKVSMVDEENNLRPKRPLFIT